MIKRHCRKCQRKKPLDAFPVKATPGPALVCNRCLGLVPTPVRVRRSIERKVQRARSTKRGKAIAAHFDRESRLALIVERADRMARGTNTKSPRCTECHALAMPRETLCCDCQARVAGVG